MIHLTDSEKRAILILGVIIVLSLVIQWLIPHRERADLFDYSFPDSLFEAAAKDTARLRPPDQKRGLQISESRVNPAIRQSTKTLKLKSIDINHATVDQLIRLPGVGKVTASEIIRYREMHGAYTRLNELDNVKRIGPKTLQKISPYIFIKKDSTRQAEEK